jgi:ribosome modulation factor
MENEEGKANFEGREAFLQKKTLKDCPYVKEDPKRFQWLGGFYLERGKTECWRKKEK